MTRTFLNSKLQVVSDSGSRKHILGRIEKKPNVGYTFVKQPFTTLSEDSQVDICYILYQIGDWI